MQEVAGGGELKEAPSGSLSESELRASLENGLPCQTVHTAATSLFTVTPGNTALVSVLCDVLPLRSVKETARCSVLHTLGSGRKGASD